MNDKICRDFFLYVNTFTTTSQHPNTPFEQLWLAKLTESQAKVQELSNRHMNQLEAIVSR